MLNLTLDQKVNLIINTCLLCEMYITRGPKFLTNKLQSFVSTSKEILNTTKESLELRIV